MIFHPARKGVAPRIEKTVPVSPAAVTFAGNERATMINEYHARIIDRLRDAAKEHGEVADLLLTLAESFPHFSSGDSTFHGDEQARAYLLAALIASAFVLLDNPEKSTD